MADDVPGRRYRAWYAMLLRLYPRPFHERLGEGMAQTFHDLCRERRDAKRGLFGFALWIFFETSVGIIRENTTHMTQLSRTILRVALVALGLLMVPLVASRLVDGWNWDAGAFVFVYVLFFGTGLAYALIARKMGSWAYKAGVGLALAAGFVMGWTTMVLMSESENLAYLAYFGVLAVGGIGAWMARLETRGMAWALFAMAAALAVVEVIAVKLWPIAPSEYFRLIPFMHVHGVFVALFAASGLLFRHASLAGSK
jgi:hypothetical protein